MKIVKTGKERDNHTFCSPWEVKFYAAVVNYPWSHGLLHNPHRLREKNRLPAVYGESENQTIKDISKVKTLKGLKFLTFEWNQ